MVECERERKRGGGKEGGGVAGQGRPWGWVSEVRRSPAAIYFHFRAFIVLSLYPTTPPHLLSLSVALPPTPPLSVSLSLSVCCAICELYSRLMLTLCRFYRFSVNSVKHLKRTTHTPHPPSRHLDGHAPHLARLGWQRPDAHVAQRHGPMTRTTRQTRTNCG